MTGTSMLLGASRRVLADLRRAVVRRLVLPLLRSRHDPEHTARGVAVGLFVALTPTVGVQMPVVLAVWGLVRLLRPSWSFNLVIALAWTWVTNVFTLGPVYYAFLVTGRLMLGRWDEHRGYETFSGRLDKSLDVDSDWITTMRDQLLGLVDTFGLPLFVGSLPWAILGGLVGYVWSLKLARAYRAKRAARLAQPSGAGGPTQRRG